MSVWSRPKTVTEDANIHDAHENAEGRDEAPIGLPEEGGTNRNDGLGEAPPPLVAEREDRRSGRSKRQWEIEDRASRSCSRWRGRRQAKAPTPNAGEGTEGERREGAGSVAKAGNLSASRKRHWETITLSWTTVRGRTARRLRRLPRQSGRFAKRKSALAAALAAGVVIPAIVVLNWPRSAPPPIVEPGMLADGQTKLMAPSAALATAPPREAPNVSRDRPIVHETRRDELSEMLSFKGADKAPAGRVDAEANARPRFRRLAAARRWRQDPGAPD